MDGLVDGGWVLLLRSEAMVVGMVFGALMGFVVFVVRVVVDVGRVVLTGTSSNEEYGRIHLNATMLSADCRLKYL